MGDWWHLVLKVQASRTARQLRYHEMLKATPITHIFQLTEGCCKQMLKVNPACDLNAQSLMEALLKEKLMQAKASHGM